MALFFAVQQIGGVAWVSAGIILFQVLVLNRHLVDTYASLTKALVDARLQSAARREADAANHAKTQFLANMSHELRTPLNAIIGYSEMMREEAQNKAREQDISDHDKVLGSAKRLLRLINDVLDVSKIEAGKMMCDVVRFHIGDEVTAACETLRPAIVSNHTTLSIDIDPQLTTATSDAFKFGQCILNLLSNATKFTNNGTIDVKVWRGTGLCADHIFVSVTDTGIGMSTDQIDTLFTPFTQADATMTRKYGGTGLGLSLSRSLARLMGGDIAVSSCLGQGSCFTLSIRPSTIGDDVYTQREDEQMARPVCADAYARAA